MKSEDKKEFSEIEKKVLKIIESGDISLEELSKQLGLSQEDTLKIFLGIQKKGLFDNCLETPLLEKIKELGLSLEKKMPEENSNMIPDMSIFISETQLKKCQEVEEARKRIIAANERVIALGKDLTFFNVIVKMVNFSRMHAINVEFNKHREIDSAKVSIHFDFINSTLRINYFACWGEAWSEFVNYFRAKILEELKTTRDFSYNLEKKLEEDKRKPNHY